MGKKAKQRRIKRAVVRLERRGHSVTTWEQLKATYQSVANVILNVSQQGVLLQDNSLATYMEDPKKVGAVANELALRLKGLSIRAKELYESHKEFVGIVPADKEELAMSIMVGYSEVGEEIQTTVLPISVELSELLDAANEKRRAEVVAQTAKVA